MSGLLNFGAIVSISGRAIGRLQSYKVTQNREDQIARYELSLLGDQTLISKPAQITGLVFGVPGWKKPYRGNLVGNIKIRYRMEDYAKIYVRDPYRIREYLLIDKGDYVTTGDEIAQNQRTNPRKESE